MLTALTRARQIKPDNFIFDSSGHLKLSDFGLATDFHWGHDGKWYEAQRKALLRKHGIDLDDGKATMGSAKGSHSCDQDYVPERGEQLDDTIFTWRQKNRKFLAHSVVGTNSERFKNRLYNKLQAQALL